MEHTLGKYGRHVNKEDIGGETQARFCQEYLGQVGSKINNIK